MGALRNIGPVSAEWLQRVGIRTRSDLVAVGVVPTFLMVRQAGFAPSLNLLWALEGAIQDIDWRAVSESDQDRLRAELAAAGERHNFGSIRGDF